MKRNIERTREELVKELKDTNKGINVLRDVISKLNGDNETAASVRNANWVYINQLLKQQEDVQRKISELDILQKKVEEDVNFIDHNTENAIEETAVIDNNNKEEIVVEAGDIGSWYNAFLIT